MRSIAAGVAAALILLSGCSSDDKPALTDDQLARELLQTVHGTKLEDAAAGPDKTRQVIADAAKTYCEVMRHDQSVGLLSTDPSDSRNATWIRKAQVEFAGEGLTAKQANDSIEISAKYKCPEFRMMLQVYVAAHGDN